MLLSLLLNIFFRRELKKKELKRQKNKFYQLFVILCLLTNIRGADKCRKYRIVYEKYRDGAIHW